MRVWGNILLTLGIIIGVLLFLPTTIGIIFTEQETGDVNFYLTFSVLFFGLPALLLITYGRKLRRRGKADAEEREREAWAANNVPAFSPVAASSASKASSQTSRQTGVSGAAMEKQNKQQLPGSAPKIVVPKVSAPPTTVVCRSCGASRNMLLGQEAACEYCGTILKA